MDLALLARHDRTAFMAGAILRLALLFLVTPVTYQTWFVPFLSQTPPSALLDPWSAFLRQGGDPLAFPYGPIYVLCFWPLTWLGSLISPAAAALGLGATVLALDFLLYRALRRAVGSDAQAVVTYGYWLSPIVLYVCYWHGQLDTLPVLILTASLLLLQERRFAASGLVLGLAIAAKLSMLISAPFIWIYSLTARRLRGIAPRLILSTFLGLLVLAPFALSPGFRHMVLGTPEKDKVFALALQYGEHAFYVMPMAFAGLVFATWRIRRFNFSILYELIGVGFFVLFLLTPASPGWALWLMPFVVVHLTRTIATGWLLAFGFSFLFVAFHLLTSTGVVVPFAALAWPEPSPRFVNLLLSAYLAAGAAIAFHMLKLGLLDNAYYRMTRRPIAIGIAGDSGTGKDTLADALRDLFGRSSTAMISGDDYHAWDRHKPMWRALTHLDPRANNLRRFGDDVRALCRGRSVQSPHYDHSTGRMTKPRAVRAADVVVASGLHTLHQVDLNDSFDLRIFLAMDDELRRFFKLRRDVRLRGHTLEAVLASIQHREPDCERYIRPQAEAADVILSLVPVNRRQIADPLGAHRAPEMALVVEAAQPLDLTALTRVLLGLVGMRVSTEIAGNGYSRIVVDGSPVSADIAAAAKKLLPQMHDLLALNPQWRPGLTGVMQLVAIELIAQKMNSNGKL
jgi:uridine kinase